MDEIRQSASKMLKEVINTIGKLTNRNRDVDRCISTIDKVIASINSDFQASEGLLWYMSKEDEHKGELRVILMHPSIEREFIISNFDLWIDDLSKYSERYISSRILEGLKNLKNHIEVGHE